MGEISLLGSPEARSMAHQAIEDTLTSQLSGEQANENTPGMDAAIAHGNFDAESTTVLPITEEYLGMLTNLNEIQESTGCEIRVGKADNEWELTLVGSEDVRQRAHHAIEDTLASRMNGDQVEADPSSDVCTVLPIPQDYMEFLTNLDQIQEYAGCQIQVKQPDQESGEWEISLFGSEAERTKAHEAIEETLRAALQQVDELGGHFGQGEYGQFAT